MFEFCNDVAIGFVFICRLTIQCHGLPVIDFVLMIYFGNDVVIVFFMLSSTNALRHVMLCICLLTCCL